MVFECRHLKLPGAIAHPTQTPCLEDVLRLWGGRTFWLGSIANRVADHLSMVSILGASHGGLIPPKTMLRTVEAFEGLELHTR